MSSKEKEKRRSPGEGGAYSYQTGAGERWYWKATITLPDDTAGPKVKRGFLTKTDALKDMRDALAKADKGEYVDPSKRPLGG